MLIWIYVVKFTIQTLFCWGGLTTPPKIVWDHLGVFRGSPEGPLRGPGGAPLIRPRQSKGVSRTPRQSEGFYVDPKKPNDKFLNLCESIPENWSRTGLRHGMALEFVSGATLKLFSTPFVEPNPP